MLRSRYALLLLALLALGCGSDADTGGDGDGDGDGDGECGELGAPCDQSCPGDLRCYDPAFCAPDRAECAGFAGAECEDPAHACSIISGSSAGACLTETEKSCVCARNPLALDDC
jgi:hypothetical protein